MKQFATSEEKEEWVTSRWIGVTLNIPMGKGKVISSTGYGCTKAKGWSGIALDESLSRTIDKSIAYKAKQ